ncbi:MAG: hypothetical protein HY365_03565 [Candidatus Aenigmarchaeota archaeon]|nr:hypothetical protein [Candidatus Aenigmarchaeota archaeon]
MRQGRQAYPALYDKAIEMSSRGASAKDVASALGVSYSAAYHWIKGLRKPEKGALNQFVEEIRKNGPLSAWDVKARFPKHNELFLTATKRAMPVKRHTLPKKFGNYSTWYFIPGQESALKQRVSELLDRYKEMKQQIIEALGAKRPSR